MSFTPRIAPVGRYFSTASEEPLAKLSSKEKELQVRINNQIASLITTVDTLQNTRTLQSKIKGLQSFKSTLVDHKDRLEQAISHKAFLYPEERSFKELHKLTKLDEDIQAVENLLEKLTVKQRV